MIATDALARAAHNSTAENRRQGFDLRDIEHLFLPLVLNGSLGEILAYLARASAGGFTSNRTWLLHRGQTVSKLNSRPCTNRGQTVSKLNSRPCTLPISLLQQGQRISLRFASFIEGMLCTRQQSAGTHLWPSTRTREGPWRPSGIWRVA